MGQGASAVKVKAPDWLPVDAIQKEVGRIGALGLPKEELEARLKAISNNLTSLQSIRSAEIKVGSIEVVPRVGLLPTSIGGDIGYDMASHASTGFANFFEKGEIFEAEGRYSASKSPSLTLSDAHPIFRNGDFSMEIPYSKIVWSVLFDSSQIVNEWITTGHRWLSLWIRRDILRFLRK
jgi:hypothetical protein